MSLGEWRTGSAAVVAAQIPQCLESNCVPQRAVMEAREERVRRETPGNLSIRRAAAAPRNAFEPRGTGAPFEANHRIPQLDNLRTSLRTNFGIARKDGAIAFVDRCGAFGAVALLQRLHCGEQVGEKGSAGGGIIQGVQPGKYTLKASASNGTKSFYAKQYIMVGNQVMEVEIPYE